MTRRTVSCSIAPAPAPTAPASGTANLTGSTPPQWLKLNRTGNLFTGYVSPDGINWTVLDSASITMNSTLLVGFAVTSRNNGHLDTGVFDNVSVTGQWPVLPGTAAPLIAVAGDSQSLLSWSLATNATGYNLSQATTAGGPFNVIATNVPSLAFTNTGLANGALYYYVVTGTNFYGAGPASGVTTVRPVSSSPPQLGFALLANQMQFNWPTDHLGWRLQAQTNPLNTGLGTNWSAIPASGATNQIFLPPAMTSGSVFYRLIYP